MLNPKKSLPKDRFNGAGAETPASKLSEVTTRCLLQAKSVSTFPMTDCRIRTLS